MTDYSLFKTYTPITKEKQMKLMNHKYLSDKKYIGEQFSYNDSINDNSIVIQSCTGTGKQPQLPNISANISKISNLKYYLLLVVSL